jgi:hypothetical protein
VVTPFIDEEVAGLVLFTLGRHPEGLTARRLADGLYVLYGVPVARVALAVGVLEALGEAHHLGAGGPTRYFAGPPKKGEGVSPG